jgi:hypothetical protein
MKTTAVFLLVLFAILVACTATQRPYTYQTFQLVYHSDTRGYVQPCG